MKINNNNINLACYYIAMISIYMLFIRQNNNRISTKDQLQSILIKYDEYQPASNRL